MATVSLQKEFKIDNKKNVDKLIKNKKETKPYKRQTKGKIIIK